MIYLKAIVLAVVEGATEFLPVSSTGHLILVEELIRLTADPSFNKTFMIVIQLPAILSVLVYFRKDLWPGGKPPERQREILLLWTKTGVAVLPAVVLGSQLNGLLERYLFAPVPVAVALFVGGVILIVLERRPRAATVESVNGISFKLAFGIGLFQCLAMIPGTSRSAATIIGAMLLGVRRPAAAEFSFFLAVPTMIGATAYELTGSGLTLSGEQWAIIAVGSVVSFAVAYAAVAGLMAYVRHNSFAVFGWYRIALAVVVLAAMATGLFGSGEPASTP